MPSRKSCLITLAVALAAAISLIPAFAQEKTDYSLVHLIREEAFVHSQVMDTLAFLTDRYGPRLAASPEFDEAAEWTMKRLTSWGMATVHAESWGPFGRTWSLKHYSVEMIEPRYSLLAAMPLAWSEPTGKPINADPILAVFNPTNGNPKKTAADFERYTKEWHGKLRGKVVLYTRPRTSSLGANPDLHRYTDADLAGMAKAPDPAAPKANIKLADVSIPDDPAEAAEYIAKLPNDVRTVMNDKAREDADKRDQWFVSEGVVAMFLEDTRAHEGLMFAEAAGTRKAADHLSLPKFRVTEEQYNRITRLLERKETVKLRVDLEAAVGDRDVNAKNLVAELPGGATDNAAGSAVMMEVMRILSTLHLKLDRTVRLALWSGEEEGLLGSKAYVKEHFGDPATMVTTGEQGKLAAYFNMDNGSGRIRGVYLQGNDAARPFFERAFVPLHDLGVGTISIRNTGGTDHLSFDAVGLAGFQFIQDPLDYSTITHHSSMDTYDHLVPADLMQAAAVIADLVAIEANAPEMMPRKPLPAPSKQ